MAEWEKYKVVIPGKGAAAEGVAFETVAHIAHLKAARRILEDGFLRAGLVNDRSLLDTTRTCVTFLSANSWYNGSIYGNVEWRYDWRKLVSGRKVYWVEERTANRFPVYRFLLSAQNPASLPGLIPYDPKVDKGPLRERDGTWYCNRKDCVSEFLVDGDLALEDCSEFDFVGHNPDFCSLKSCSEKGTRLHDAMAQTMAFVFGCEIRSLDPILRREPRYRKDKRLADAVGDGLAHVYTLLTRTQKKPDGTINDPETAIAMVRGALALFGTGQISRARDIVWNLKNNDVLYQALESIVKQHFDIENWHLVEN